MSRPDWMATLTSVPDAPCTAAEWEIHDQLRAAASAAEQMTQIAFQAGYAAGLRAAGVAPADPPSTPHLRLIGGAS